MTWLSGKKVGHKRNVRREKARTTDPPFKRDDYSRFRTIAERTQMKPERSMQTRVAITVTKVPLSVAE